ncbi:bacteriohemerythrin [Geobacter sulfurreducens]|uniref:Hemerythrin family protein n=1 Tax=Geobacter sulfurreducens (strain ATCC 51573 / DSM 12127 / PCA) TaxID=243231 RepID=Q74G47_GEOSL|nr:bacteriohemerythrin [Geobacter sulfurreducens]BET60229.1 bacteriohemerythrin [Geobacter sp. 60473]AAR33734.1 hemerythrin family protein [Geobacter sulfurreducens PCA]ADI83233.1 hemerythrin family protein [Geobacter sulfurreducens KN400]QVW35659.1 bacteriohemerythrin [Geobacter sulfurreducens]UAC04483.1 bacteriohemerythrin [Geobacter sulfurreducens]
MALISWSDSLSVKVKQFDDQHKKLVDMVNQLFDAMKAGKGNQVMGDILKSLIQYTQTHFAAEERIMKQYGYPDFEAHKKEHNALVMQVLDLQKQFQEGKAVLTQNVMTFLRDWLSKHIQGDDKKYGVYLNGKGVS